ncbi:thiamine pyrophosphate-binding protein [Glaciimonas immobilis]|uniref:thiamine pyrophosphate-binding protein n=1 Tax=Glaciimonas immobilis TaxID=728004 RepID=UPI00143B08B3|nr:thiamine pyrophosphate-binding protein [Glaciimonas immobilis]KAF3998392.1 thiamine pyrophosphate-binding protein [Glaciimonas immobilis]
MNAKVIISGSGGRILVECLLTHHVDHVFCVPGESYLNALDALYDVRERIALRICRHESGAANMAEAYGKLTGKPGIVMVTRGPGAMNAATGLHTAYQDSTPLIMFVGQVARDCMDREAFQEIDYRRMFGPVTKWVAQIDDAKRIPEYVSRAFQTAVSGRPGPVVLALPEDMLVEITTAFAAPTYTRVAAAPTVEAVQQLAALLSAAQRPIAILGGSGWTQQAYDDIRRFSEAWQLPTACAFRFQDLFDNTHSLYAGDVGIGINPVLAQRIKDADVVLAIGPRLGEMTTSGYTLFDIPTPRQHLVHVHAGAEELGSVYAAEVMINAGMPEFAAVAARLVPVNPLAWVGQSGHSGQAEAAHADYLAWSTPPTVAGPVQMGEIMRYLREHLSSDAIICNGAGNYATWVHRFYYYRYFRSQLAPTSGAMGYGVPAAIAAKSLYPERMVIAFAGDGCFMMSSQELATAMQYALPVIFIVVNNGIYGTIRMHQERTYPGRVHGTTLTNPDFAAYARSFGALGATVEKTEDFIPAFEQACASGLPALIEIRLSPEVITPTSSLSSIREQALRTQKMS